MARAYSQYLRERVLTATAAGTSARQSGGTIRRRRIDGDRVGPTGATEWRALRAAAGAAPAVQARRPRRFPTRVGGVHLRHHPERDEGAAARGAGRVGRDWDALAVLRPPGLQLGKKPRTPPWARSCRRAGRLQMSSFSNARGERWRAAVRPAEPVRVCWPSWWSRPGR